MEGSDVRWDIPFREINGFPLQRRVSCMFTLWNLWSAQGWILEKSASSQGAASHQKTPLRWRLSKLSWFKNYHYAIKWPISSVEPVILAKMAIFPPHLCDKLQKHKTQATLWTACAHDGGMSPNHLEMLAHHRLSGAVSCRITFISHSVIHYIIQLIHWLLLLSLSLTMWSGPISFGLFF